MIHTKVLLVSKNEKAMEVIESTTGKRFSIPMVCFRGFQFHADCVDADQLPMAGREYPAVMKDDHTVYFDRFNTEFWNYSPDASQPEDCDWLQIVRRLLELSMIGSLTPELTAEMLQLYRAKQYVMLKEKLIKECRLFDFILADESQYLENKSSLLYPAGFQKGDLLTPELKNKQADVLSEALVGAANANLKKDFHFVIGVTDDKKLTNNVGEEVEQFYDGNMQKFIDMFTNRLNQLVENPMFTGSLRFETIRIEGNTLLDIVVPPWEGDLLLYRKQAYLRTQATTTRLEGWAVVNFVKALECVKK